MHYSKMTYGEIEEKVKRKRGRRRAWGLEKKFCICVGSSRS